MDTKKMENKDKKKKHVKLINPIYIYIYIKGVQTTPPLPSEREPIWADTVPPTMGDSLWVIPHPYWWVVTRRLKR